MNVLSTDDDDYEYSAGESVDAELYESGGVLSMSRSNSLQLLLSKISFNRNNTNLYCGTRRERNAYWVSIFSEAFLTLGDGNYKDDLLLFVRKTEEAVQTGSYSKSLIEVFRKTSSRLPTADDRLVDWEETVYLNLIMQHFTYLLTVAIITRTGRQEYQILRKVSHKVYASPSKRDMDSKGTEEQITYPFIYFSVENFDEVFSECVIRDSESVCVELTAYDHRGCLQGVIFMGTVRYGTIKAVFDSKSSLSTRLLTKNTASWFRPSKRTEFIRMLGPDGKGHAQVAVSAVDNLNGSERSLDGVGGGDTAFIPSKMAVSFTNGSGGGGGGGPGSVGNCFSVDSSPVRRQSEDVADSRLSSLSSGRYFGGGLDYTASCRSSSSRSSKVADLVAGGPTVRNVLHTRIKKSQSDGGTFDGLGLGLGLGLGPQRIDTETGSRTGTADCSIFSEEFDEYSHISASWGQSFNQAWYWFKERRKVCSVALNVSVACISISWHRIIADVLDTRLKPVLTFDSIPRD